VQPPQEMPAAFITSRMDCVLVVIVGNSMHWWRWWMLLKWRDIPKYNLNLEDPKKLSTWENFQWSNMKCSISVRNNEDHRNGKNVQLKHSLKETTS
jgi:hypothetical protein